MKCPVCGKQNIATVCPDCGFDDSRNYERYPSFGQISGVPSISARRRWSDRTGDSKSSPGRHPILTAMACAAILMLGIWIGMGIGSSKTTHPPETTAPPITTAPPETTTPPETTVPPETTTPPEPGWEANLLRADQVPYRGEDYWDREEEAVVFPVFGSEYRREQIASVTFLDTLADAPENAWDVSEAGDGRVMAWVTPANELYDLYIAAEGGVNAANACSDLFTGYSNAKTINFGEAFHTTGAADMSYMFLGCKALTELNLNRFDTSAVKDMSWMFQYCRSLTELNVSSFDTSAVQDMSSMFSYCDSLTELTLGDCFDTSAVQDMSYMFSVCSDLTALTLGDRFDTSNVRDMSCMFASCYTLTDLNLSCFDTSSVLDMHNMFASCYVLTDLNLGSFDTSAVKDMSGMFQYCQSLNKLDLSNFDTSSVQDMSRMFYWCEALTELTLGERFITTNADTEDMFDDCPAGADYRHLLN